MLRHLDTDEGKTVIARDIRLDLKCPNFLFSLMLLPRFDEFLLRIFRSGRLSEFFGGLRL